MCMFTLYIVFHRNEEFHDDITLSAPEEIMNEIVEQLEETEGAQQQVWSVIQEIITVLVSVLES